MMYDPLDIYMDWFADILLRILESMFISEIGL